MIDEDGPKPQKKGFAYDPSDPAMDVDTLLFYRELLSEIEEEKKRSNIWETIIRFEDSEKVYGARYLAMVYNKLIELSVITDEFIQMTFEQFIEYIDVLITKMTAKKTSIA